MDVRIDIDKIVLNDNDNTRDLAEMNKLATEMEELNKLDSEAMRQ